MTLATRAARGPVVLYVCVNLIAAALPLSIAWLTKHLIDHLVARGDLQGLVFLAIGMVAVGLAAGTVPQVTDYLSGEIERRVRLVSQDRLFAAVEEFEGMSRFEDPPFLDRLRLAQQVSSSTPSQVIVGILGAVRMGLTVIAFLASLAILSPWMAALVVVGGVPTLVAQTALSRRRAKMYWNVGPRERRELFYGQLLSSVNAAKELRLFGLGSFFRARMMTDRRAINVATRSVERRAAFVQSGLGLLASAVSGAGLLWALTAAHSGELTVGDVTMFVAAVAAVQGGLAGLAVDLANSHNALLMFNHYVAVTSAEPDLPRAPSPKRLPRLRHGIEFRDVWFRYSESDPWILRGVSLFIPHGQAVALVGRNGAGKSTLVSLICRFYDPTSGAILWDGVDIRDVDVADLRSAIGAVFQDYMQYHLTAAENIGLGDLAVIQERAAIEHAASRAGIHSTLADLPRGYNTLLSRIFFAGTDNDTPETGIYLSGGQWQRLALARAFLRDRRDLMILDEPSAGLDAEAEHDIHISLSRQRRGRTSVLISHRLGAVRAADAIIVIDEGTIVEQGGHRELMLLGGRYAKLFAMQASGYQETLVVSQAGSGEQS